MTEFLLGGVAACCAGIITNPLEVIKTRIQLQGETQKRGSYKVHYKNVFHAFYTVAKNESIISLQKGLVPAIHYQFFMNGVRLGAFQCFDNFGITRGPNGELVFYKTVIAGAASGCIGAMFGSPFYMIKTQLQARSNALIAVGHQHPHGSMSDAFKIIFNEQGIKGLWRGVSGSMARVTVGSAAQLSIFSKVKSLFDSYDVIHKDSWINTMCSAMFGGVVVCLMMTPFDVVSTRLYNQPVDRKTGRGLKYSGLLNCIYKIHHTEGVLGFYKGWSASFIRLGPHTVLSLLFWQEIRKLYFKIQSGLSHSPSPEVTTHGSLLE